MSIIRCFGFVNDKLISRKELSWSVFYFNWMNWQYDCHRILFHLIHFYLKYRISWDIELTVSHSETFPMTKCIFVLVIKSFTILYFYLKIQYVVGLIMSIPVEDLRHASSRSCKKCSPSCSLFGVWKSSYTFKLSASKVVIEL